MDTKAHSAKTQTSSRHGRVALLAVLAILPVVLTALAQPFLPDSVPLHYGASGPDRLSLLSPALYMLITGKGLSLVNFHPGTSDLEKRTGADKQQARAIGGLLLFLTVIVLVELLVTVK
ncbi:MULTISPECIES: DUF1648 domain-containing protein [Eggerthella]|uniref:DUF1648 domain-containing protein n=1 Tax=Eggerthella TaxID=84111 RepID=UPI0001F0182D|nr:MULTISPECIES: DUF1648 domain-containing protein [Eggerthella]EFV32119.1 hypothetical protein HMPREF1023_02543 [Eggerthella sp. 1_3_56FAA]MCB6941371.1 DUF1648 domain-containing protein [Eggerthella lenta]MCQ5138246.1 DUF1648 domain-containing protein [Eggerthella lenta]MDB1775956.1 DUF1648 domain-containing protein [Eggerthella lenta]MDB1799634.1 DUF1648 domain-containing protein [Eggerthella lenta]